MWRRVADVRAFASGPRPRPMWGAWPSAAPSGRCMPTRWRISRRATGRERNGLRA